MEFRLNENAFGEFEIVQYVPDLVGTFTDQETAEKVLGFLEADAVNATRKAQVAAKESEPKAVLHLQSQAATAKDKPADTVSPNPNGVAPSSSDVAHFSWSDEELAEAFERIAKGEKIRAVADSFKKSWTALRSKWAAHKKAQPETASPVEKVADAISALKGQVACNLCGHHFTPTDNNADHCARCRLDA